MVTVTMKPRRHLARCLLKLKRKEMLVLFVGEVWAVERGRRRVM